ncbi:S2-RNase [Pyrus ussuriensis x Pyrus communis]|uniref:S2-RNase n=1 Tax=Pyrus ussuriensis x Pyrus communis TaxID=2448454 RepID=A0A5N5HBA6_9ROSA|nr:S2-RNase [Pyrus ussuriensis x Pyrus communis]
MSSSSHKSNDSVLPVLPLYRQGGSLDKVDYFKAAHFKTSSDHSFKDFLEAYRHVIPSRVRVKRVKKGSSHSEFGSTSKTSPDMNKVYVALGISAEYCEWRWLLSPFFQEKGGLPPEKGDKLDANEGGTKRSSPPAQEMPFEKKPKTSSAAREGLPATDRLVIDLTSSKRKKYEAARSEQTTPVMPNKFVPRHLLGAKFGSLSERLAIMKGDKVDSTAKVATRHVEKEETARVGSCEKSTKPIFRKVAEICTFFKPDLLEDMDACAKLVDSVKGVICPRYQSCQGNNKAEAYSFVKKIKRLEFELVALKGSNIFAHISLQLETARQEIIQDLECELSKLHFAAYAKDKELIAAYNQVIHFKKKEVDELQCVRVGLLNENDQLKGEKSRLETLLVQSQADFYKLGYKDFETFISPEDLLAFTFEAFIAEVVGEVGAQARASRGVPMIFDLFVVHGDEGLTTLAAYSAHLVRTFLYEIHLFGAFVVGIENRIVGCFSLPIALGISRRGHVLLDAIFLEELHQIFSYKLRVIICDDGLRDTKSANGVSLYGALYVRLSCGYHGLCFHPFSEVVSYHDHHVSDPSSGDISFTKLIAHCMNGQGLIYGCSSLADNAGISL